MDRYHTAANSRGAYYLYLVYKRDEGGSPDELVTRDKPLLACLAGWALTAGLLLAIFR